MAILSDYWITPEVQARFWEKVERGDAGDCWPWAAYRERKGYGRFKLCSYVTVQAHRFAYAATAKTDPGDFVVMHACDNPPCCNPSHLRLGTVADNNADKAAKGRARGAPVPHTAALAVRAMLNDAAA